MVEEICGQPQAGVVFPGVFDGWRVVDVDAPNRVQAKQFERVGVADIGGVDRRSIGDRVAGDLDERAEIAVELTRDEARHLLGDEIVVRAQSRGGGRILRRARVGEARHVERRDRWALPIAASQRVAAHFEPSAKRCELGKGGVADRAGQAGLPAKLGKATAGATERVNNAKAAPMRAETTLAALTPKLDGFIGCSRL